MLPHLLRLRLRESKLASVSKDPAEYFPDAKQGLVRDGQIWIQGRWQPGPPAFWSEVPLPVMRWFHCSSTCVFVFIASSMDWQMPTRSRRKQRWKSHNELVSAAGKKWMQTSFQIAEKHVGVSAQHFLGVPLRKYDIF